nr:MAG TPA: hypothetical protein [Caudoviricetes sp.]
MRIFGKVQKVSCIHPLKGENQFFLVYLSSKSVSLLSLGLHPKTPVCPALVPVLHL